MVLGLLLLAVAVKANSEFTQMVASPTGPSLEDLSFPTKVVLKFVPAVAGAPGSAPSPADFASMINKAVLGCGGGGFLLVVFGAVILLTENRQRSDNSVT